MSLFLAYHNSETLVVASDRRSVIQNDMGKVLSGTNDCPKFVTLPNGIVVVALGRADLALRLRNGTVQLASEHPHLRFSQLADAYEEVMAMMFSKRKTPRDSDLLVGGLCGWDAEVGHQRTVSWHSSEKFARWEKYNPGLNLTALGVVHVNTKKECDHVASMIHSMKPAEKTPAVIARYMRSAVRSVAKNHADLVSPQAYFAAFEKNQRVTLPVEFELPPLMADAARAGASLAMSGESRFFIGSITTPAAGALDTVGNEDGGAGGATTGMVTRLAMAVTNITATFGAAASVTDPQNAVDGDETTFATVKCTGAALSGAAAILNLSGSPAVGQRFSSAQLELVIAVPSNSYPSTPECYVTYSLDGGNSYTTLTAASFNGPATAAKARYTVDLPANQNMSQVFVSFVAAGAGASGTAEVDVYSCDILARG